MQRIKSISFKKVAAFAVGLIIFQFFINCTGNHSASINDRLEQPSSVVLVSIDGFRYDYAEKFGAENLLEIANDGTRSESLIPCYPSKTFPNHYSIITGLYPDNHGIVDNYFYDKNTAKYFTPNGSNNDKDKWFGGTPLWELTNRQGLKSASYFWIGSDMNINNQHPSYYKNYQEETPNSTRVDQVIDWLKMPASERPQFITLYFSDVDTKGHDFGPDSDETKNAVLAIDREIGRLYKEIQGLTHPVNLLIVSDHGMTELNASSAIPIHDLIEDEENFNYVPRDALLMLYLKDSLEIETIYSELKNKENEQFTAYKKQGIPQHLHFGNSSRVGDIVLMANPPNYFGFEENSIGKGSHGFDPYSTKNMHGIFYAIGPDIKNKITIESFENIHIYPLIAEILDLDYDSNSIDGKPEVLSNVIKVRSKK